jgi:hypothetical protein
MNQEISSLTLQVGVGAFRAVIADPPTTLADLVSPGGNRITRL